MQVSCQPVPVLFFFFLFPERVCPFRTYRGYCDQAINILRKTRNEKQNVKKRHEKKRQEAEKKSRALKPILEYKIKRTEEKGFSPPNYRIDVNLEI